MTENNEPQYTPGGSPANTYSQPPLVTSPYLQRTTPPPAPKKQAWWKKPAVLIIGFGVACALVGGGIGASGEPETVEVIKEVQVPGPERTVTKEVKVPVPTTPASCLEAITLYESAMDQMSVSLGHIMDGAYTAASASTEKVAALVPKVKAAKAECRSAK